MRTHLLASLVGLSLLACAGQIDGGGGGDDDGIPETCGNNATDPGETCDDGNNTDGDGCSASCQMEAVPSLATSVDRATVATELGKSERITVTFTSVEGFTGNANIAVSFVDAANATIPGIIAAGPTTMTLAAGQSLPAEYTVAIPSNATGQQLLGTLKLDVTSTGGNANLTSAFTIEPIFTVSYAATTTDQDSTHPVRSGAVNKNITVKRGATIRFKNDSNIRHVTHGSGIFAHEDQNSNTTGLPGNFYEQPTIQAPASSPDPAGNLGCHDHDSDAGYVTFTTEN